MSRFFMVHCV